MILFFGLYFSKKEIKADTTQFSYDVTITNEELENIDFTLIKVTVYTLNEENQEYKIGYYDYLDSCYFDENGHLTYTSEHENLRFRIDLATLPSTYGLISDIEKYDFSISKIDTIIYLDGKIQLYDSGGRLLEANYTIEYDNQDTIIVNANGVNRFFEIENEEIGDFDNDNGDEDEGEGNTTSTNQPVEVDQLVSSRTYVHNNKTISISENFILYSLNENDTLDSNYINNTRLITNEALLFYFNNNLINTDLSITFYYSIYDINYFLDSDFLSTDESGESNGTITVYIPYVTNHLYTYIKLVHEISHLLMDNLNVSRFSNAHLSEPFATFFELVATYKYTYNSQLTDVNNILKKRHTDFFTKMINDNSSSNFLKDGLEGYKFYYLSENVNSNHEDVYYTLGFTLFFIFDLADCDIQNFDVFNYLTSSFDSTYNNNNSSYSFYVEINLSGYQRISYRAKAPIYSLMTCIKEFSDLQGIKLNDYYVNLNKIINHMIIQQYDYSFMEDIIVVIDKERITNNGEFMFTHKMFKLDALEGILHLDLDFNNVLFNIIVYDTNFNIISNTLANSFSIERYKDDEPVYIYVGSPQDNESVGTISIKYINQITEDSSINSLNQMFYYIPEYDELVNFEIKDVELNTYNYFIIKDWELDQNISELNGIAGVVNLNKIYKLEKDKIYIIKINLPNSFDLENNPVQFHLDKTHLIDNVKNYRLEECNSSIKIYKLVFKSYGNFNIIVDPITYNNSQSTNVLFAKERNGLIDFNLTQISNSNRSSYINTDMLYADSIYVIVENNNIINDYIIQVYTMYSQETTVDIIPDKSNGTFLGTEVTVLHNAPESNTMTVGFTRCMYLNRQGLESLRQMYYWYSTDEDVLEVSQFGTVFAKTAGSCRIVCIYKNDFSIYGEIWITASEDTQVQPVSLMFGMDIRETGQRSGTEVTQNNGSTYSIGYHTEAISITSGFTRYICLGDDAPSKILQNYEWTSSNPESLSVSQFGTLTGLQPNNLVTITGVYKYDNRFTVTILMEVEE